MYILADSQPRGIPACSVSLNHWFSSFIFKKRFCIGYFEYLQVIIVSSIVDPVKNEDASSLPLRMVEVRPEYE